MPSLLESSFVVVGRARPVDLVLPGSELTPALAPYIAVEAELGGDVAELALVSGDDRLAGRMNDTGLSLEVTAGGRTTEHRSRRRGKPEAPVTAIALTLTGTHLVVHAREGHRWRVRGRVDLGGRVDVHREDWLEAVAVDVRGAEAHRAGRFGQVGLRDLRVVTHADGGTYRDGDRVLLTATSAGPGAFRSGHCSVWALDTSTLHLQHRADLFVRRRGLDGTPGVYGDHAAHLVRDGDHWLLAACTWADFDRDRRDAAQVSCVVAESDADVTRGVHVLDARPLALPTTGLTSVGVWDPHLVRDGDRWLVGYVSATRFFRFHPVVATGPDLDALELRAAASGRRATEGPTLWRDDGSWRVLASDGRDGRSGQRERFPVLDLDLRETGVLDAHYPTNIPWPTLLEDDAGLLMIGFNGRPYGGRLTGYGSHGEVVFQRAQGSRRT